MKQYRRLLFSSVIFAAFAIVTALWYAGSRLKTHTYQFWMPANAEMVTDIKEWNDKFSTDKPNVLAIADFEKYKSSLADSKNFVFLSGSTMSYGTVQGTLHLVTTEYARGARGFVQVTGSRHISNGKAEIYYEPAVLEGVAMILVFGAVLCAFGIIGAHYITITAPYKKSKDDEADPAVSIA